MIYLAAALAAALRDGLTRLPASLLVASAAFAGYASAYVYEGRSEGVALVVVTAVYLAAAVALFVRDRDSASILWAIGLGVGAIAAADLASGATLTIAWSTEAVVLAWLARRIDEPRFQLASLGWLTLAAVHGLGFDAPPRLLFSENLHPERAVPSVVALALAFGAVGLWSWARDGRAEGSYLQRTLDELARAQGALRLAAFGAAALAAVYAASLAVLFPTLWSSWARGHVAVTGLWSALAVAAVLVGVRGANRVVTGAGLMWTAATVALAVGYDLDELGGPAWQWSFALAAIACLAVAHLYALLGPGDRDGISVGAAAFATALGGCSLAGLLDGTSEGLALLALAAGLGALAGVSLSRRRELATALWISGLALALTASVELLDGTLLLLAWSAAAALLAVAARLDERLELGALALIGVALATTVVLEAPLADLFVAHRHPAGSAPALLAVVAATLAFARLRALLRAPLVWVAGALTVYASSLGILEAFEATGGDVSAAFQRGHTAVSALWGAIGLALLYLGLQRSTRALQLGGFALFGIALAKLFVFDLAYLSSVARAFSFLAIGSVLLLGGFFVQRARVDSAA